MTFSPKPQLDWGARFLVLHNDVACLIKRGHGFLEPTLFGYMVFHEIDLLGGKLSGLLWLTARWIIFLIFVVECGNKSVVLWLLMIQSELIFKDCEHSLYFFKMERVFVLSAILEHELIW